MPSKATSIRRGFLGRVSCSPASCSSLQSCDGQVRAGKAFAGCLKPSQRASEPRAAAAVRQLGFAIFGLSRNADGCSAHHPAARPNCSRCTTLPSGTSRTVPRPPRSRSRAPARLRLGALERSTRPAIAASSRSSRPPSAYVLTQKKTDGDPCSDGCAGTCNRVERGQGPQPGAPAAQLLLAGSALLRRASSGNTIGLLKGRAGGILTG
jgi:hypothetical protein